MIFGKVAKSLVFIAGAAVVAGIVWPGLGDIVYPGGSKRLAAVRGYLPETVREKLPAWREATAPRQLASGRPGAGGTPANGPGNGRSATGRTGGAPPQASGRPGGRPGAGAPPNGRRAGPPGRGGRPAGRGRRRGPRGPMPVEVGKASLSSMPYVVEALGTAEAFSTVNLKSRVDSYIEKILVQDGAAVKAGDVLVKLDDRQIRAQLKAAEAQLAKNMAELEQAKRDVDRFTELLRRRAGTRISVDTARTKVATVEASILADKAQIENLKVQLSYYTIKAPIDGRVGVFNAKEGNIIRAGDNSATGILTTIVQSTPIYVTFSLPQHYLPMVRAAIENKTSIVEARPQGSDKAASGIIALIDNQISASTGTLTIRARFDNKDGLLWPGQLCNLRVTLREEQNVVSVPNDAVQSGQSGNFVFVVEDGKARVQNIKLGRAQDGRYVVLEGLSGKETVVTDGQLGLRNGASVRITNTNAGKKPDGKPERET